MDQSSVSRRCILALEIIRNSKNLGFAEGNNFGMRRALAGGADYVLLLNNDTIVDRYFLDRLVAAAEGDQTIGFAGPKVYYLDHEAGGHVISFAGGPEHVDWPVSPPRLG